MIRHRTQSEWAEIHKICRHRKCGAIEACGIHDETKKINERVSDE